MTWEPRPVPQKLPDTEPFWEGAAEGTFLLNHCNSCGLTYYYPRGVCPDCFSSDIKWQEAAGTGEVYSHSVSEATSGWPDEALPMILAYVELDEGPRVMTNIIDCDPAAVSISSPVEVRFVPTKDEDRAIPVFTLSED